MLKCLIKFIRRIYVLVYVQKIKPHGGLEPPTFRLLSERSTNWANAAITSLPS